MGEQKTCMEGTAVYWEAQGSWWPTESLQHRDVVDGCLESM